MDRGPGDGAVDGAGHLGAAARPARGHDRDAAVHGDEAWLVQTPHLPLKANGSGDVTAALFTAHLLDSGRADEALAKTVSSVMPLLKRTHESGRRELQLVQSQEEIAHPEMEFTPKRVRWSTRSA